MPTCADDRLSHYYTLLRIFDTLRGWCSLPPPTRTLLRTFLHRCHLPAHISRNFPIDMCASWEDDGDVEHALRRMEQ